MKVKVETDFLKEKIVRYIDRLHADRAAADEAAKAERMSIVQKFIEHVPAVTEQLGRLAQDEGPADEWDDVEDLNVSVSSSRSRNRAYTTITVTIDDVSWLNAKTDFETLLVSAERALELLNGTTQKTVSIGPDDFLYKYLAKPEASRR